MRKGSPPNGRGGGFGADAAGAGSEGWSLFERSFFLQKRAPFRGLFYVAHPDRFRNPIQGGVLFLRGGAFFLKRVFHRPSPGKKEVWKNSIKIIGRLRDFFRRFWVLDFRVSWARSGDRPGAGSQRICPKKCYIFRGRLPMQEKSRRNREKEIETSGMRG